LQHDTLRHPQRWKIGRCADQDGAEWWELKEGPDIPVKFTGAVTFYGSDDRDQWWEFCAFIEGGTCFKIVQIEPIQ